MPLVMDNPSMLGKLADRVKAHSGEAWDRYAACFAAALAAGEDFDSALGVADEACSLGGRDEGEDSPVSLQGVLSALNAAPRAFNDGDIHTVNKELLVAGLSTVTRIGDGSFVAVTPHNLHESRELVDAELLEAFTGTVTDSAGRVYHYVNGVRVSQGQFQAHPPVLGGAHGVYHPGHLHAGTDADTHVAALATAASTAHVLKAVVRNVLTIHQMTPAQAIQSGFARHLLAIAGAHGHVKTLTQVLTALGNLRSQNWAPAPLAAAAPVGGRRLRAGRIRSPRTA